MYSEQEREGAGQNNGLSVQPDSLREQGVGAVWARPPTISGGQGVSLVWQAEEGEPQGPQQPEESGQGVRDPPFCWRI